MIEGQGIFQLAARSTAYATVARLASAGHPIARNVFERTDKNEPPLGSVMVSANATVRAMFQSAWDQLHEDENQITDDMLKQLEKASKSDNKEIAAERLRQAKAKLRALRLQAQMAAASGDPKQLRRIAQQAAQAAREVAGAARGLAEGIASSAVPAPNGSAVETATGAPAPLAVPGAGLFSGEREALRQLGDEARSAIAQARGLIAFMAQAARMRRQHKPDDDEDAGYRALQLSVSDAEHGLDGALAAAWQSLQAGPESSLSSVQTTVLLVETTTVTVTAQLTV
jgi:hypothetical protein